MDIGVPIKDLGALDATQLRDAILSQDDSAWDEDEQRQVDYDVHRQTKSIVMLFASQTWPRVTVTREKGWDRIADVANPIMAEIIERFYPPGGTVIRAVAARLLAGASITPHIDSLPSFAYGHRIHIPITTNKLVRFMIDGRPYRFEIGHVYEINNLKTHSVANAGKEDRISFIFDYVPPDLAKAQNAEFVNG
ncbi:MAG: aspartyl/asparaginyl beta-hydroxylase domain-containing protein [Gammaproteobacteria bacterium]|nr:aspartyl/asparaginyl beta-hydroxylase domain-containing protein [Gammaproteobacteria bacterium]